MACGHSELGWSRQLPAREGAAEEDLPRASAEIKPG